MARSWLRRHAAPAVALVLAACSTEEGTFEPDRPSVTLQQVTFADLRGWTTDRLEEVLPAMRASCAALLTQALATVVGPAGMAGTVADWRGPCVEVTAAAGPEAARVYFESTFTPFAVAGSEGTEVLFTGYYEPEVSGSRQREKPTQVPLYGPPADLVMIDPRKTDSGSTGKRVIGRVIGGVLQPHFTRDEIEGGALDGRGLEFVWIDDAVEAFTLHVQGSGRIRFPDGTIARVGYAGTNGHPFVPIARRLIERGEMRREEASMQAVREWLWAHPDEAPALMRENPRYTFFRLLEGEGPVGTQGSPLSPGRSLAVDPDFLPLGGPVWVETTYPAGTPESGRPLRRLMVAQDTGGAIKGPLRGDIFFGAGEGALAYAGPMRQAGRYFVLLPKSVAERRDPSN